MLEMINLNTVPAFLLILVRVTAFFVTMPIFSYRTVPTQFKIGFGFFLAWIMFYTMQIPEIAFDGTYILLLLKETLVGLLLGLIAYIILSAIQIAGGFIDFQMGFAIANVVDPQTGAQSPLVGQYFYTIALLFLLTVNGHHLLINGIFYSYETIPLDRLIDFSNENIAYLVIETFNEMFIIAFQMSIPIVGCLFLVDVALGIIARTVPQLNVFVVGLPLKILVALFVLVIFSAIYIMLVKNLFELVLQVMQGLMQLFGGA
ncbi:flagellar type III secretion system protein FliR [Aquibacillus koreensis]|uniref:Flagellar biosynthetic protein FliR n=1 Tax=Aquibacillus koreensis TaxID=279446 RepID=A0A9X4AJJ6_9BACI|nr:flagellar biosynthetic protein FliR [Aquibacillus koreensis]MCT2534537.1 flagellar biosynthetic protein FliR [Aquibacillus koreensis]MDC3421869.1 flagellar type III secretion system protein FliR [Aquibacillus koreensis]